MFLLLCVFTLTISSFTATKVVLFGATGRTGVLTANLLLESGCSVICPVKSMTKARDVLGCDTSKLSVLPFDMASTQSSDPRLRQILEGADVVINTASYTPNLPFIDPLGPYKIDYQAAVNIADAAKEFGCRKIILLSSILTNAPQMGELLNKNFLLLNLFGGILTCKRMAEEHIEKSGLDYAILRPAGLTDSDELLQPLIYATRDSLRGGSVARSQVASVLATLAISDEGTSKVIELCSSFAAEDISISEGIRSVVEPPLRA